jgi:hypothetical protein
VLLLFLLATPVDAFPDSTEAAAAAIEECQKEYNIIRAKDSKAELSLVELVASIKGQLQCMVALGLQLHNDAALVFKTLWLGWAEPDTIDRLL